MKNIRHSVFETNSSSTHSISISSNTNTLDTLPVDEEGKLHVEFGEFGWEEETYRDAGNKLMYAATWVFGHEPDTEYGTGNIKEFIKYKTMLEEVLKEQTGAKEIIYKKEKGRWSPTGYIDHQSSDVCEEAFESKEKLRNFIFNPTSYFETDNDNH